MKYVIKNEEPTAFINWKIQEQENLNRLYNKGDSNACWSHLGSEKKGDLEEGFIYYSKKQLVESLLEEQGFICAYCNRIINNDITKLPDFKENSDKEKKSNRIDRVCSIEHLVSRKENIEKTFEYENITATCRGGEKVPKPRHTHCDCERGSKPMPFTPLEEVCETEILYTRSGDITGLTDRAEKLIKVLGLDIPKLIEARKIEIIKSVIETQDSGTSIDLTKEKAIEKYEKIIANKPFIEFCGAIMSVLKNDLMV